jgi:DNA polymerase-3 subunit epsilon
MIDKYALRYLQVKLPNYRVDVSEFYHACKYAGAPDWVKIDLRFDSMLRDLGIPMLGQHDAYNDALMTAMAYVQLRDMRQRGARIPREAGDREPDMAIGA